MCSARCGQAGTERGTAKGVHEFPGEGIGERLGVDKGNFHCTSSLWPKVHHPFIVKLVRTFRTEKKVHLLMELVSGIELFRALDLIGILQRGPAQFYVPNLRDPRDLDRDDGESAFVCMR